jgi:hypothetical protein
MEYLLRLVICLDMVGLGLGKYDDSLQNFKFMLAVLFFLEFSS